MNTDAFNKKMKPPVHLIQLMRKVLPIIYPVPVVHKS